MTMLIVLTAISVKGLLVGKWEKYHRCFYLSICLLLSWVTTMCARIAVKFVRVFLNSPPSWLIASVWTRTCHVTGAMLLMLKLSTLIAKFSFGWQHNAQTPQPIHVHVHNSPPTAHNQAYSGWMPGSGPGGEHHYYYRAWRSLEESVSSIYFVAIRIRGLASFLPPTVSIHTSISKKNRDYLW